MKKETRESLGLLIGVLGALGFLFMALGNMKGCDFASNDPNYQWHLKHDAEARNLNDRVKILEHRLDSLITNNKLKGVKR